MVRYQLLQTELDDGYLFTSEVATLKLDADWVILSACGRRGPLRPRPRLNYAGARALLVSHWSVDSAATVKLITSAVGAITRDKTLGRPEALRRAMLALIDKGETREPPGLLGPPFIVVGEGVAR